MLEAGYNPKECLIVEDSHVGRKAAHESGSHVLGVRGLSDVNKNNIDSALAKANQANSKNYTGPNGKVVK